MGQLLYSDQRVGGLVIPEQSHSGSFDRRRVLGPAIDDEDGDPDHIFGPGARGGEGTTDVVERLASLNRQITRTDELALSILGDLPSDEHQPAPGRSDHVGIGLRCCQARGIDPLERHRSGGA